MKEARTALGTANGAFMPVDIDVEVVGQPTFVVPLVTTDQFCAWWANPEKAITLAGAEEVGVMVKCIQLSLADETVATTVTSFAE